MVLGVVGIPLGGNTKLEAEVFRGDLDDVAPLHWNFLMNWQPVRRVVQVGAILAILIDDVESVFPEF